MKKILITGANSYIGTSFEKYLTEKYEGQYIIDTLDMKEKDWCKKSFASYDSVFHVAGIAHSDSGKISEEKEKLYYSVNTDLTIKTAQKAKQDGAKQFIFMSSAIVYGASAPIGRQKRITKETPVSPENCYGDSKVQAENGIKPLNDEKFSVVILRPPMIYGKGCKGNYPLLTKIALKMPFFPYIRNERSMLYIENLCEFVRLMIENEEKGIFWPQNAEYSRTSEMVKLIAEVNGHKIWISKTLNWIVYLASKIPGKISILCNKAFGNMSYDQDMSRYDFEYRVENLRSSIERTEG